MRLQKPLLALLLSFAVPSASAASDAAQAFLSGQSLPEDAPPAALEVQRCQGGGVPEAFRTRAWQAAKTLGLTDEQAEAAAALWVEKCATRLRAAGRRARRDLGYDPRRTQQAQATAAQIAERLRRGLDRAPGALPAVGPSGYVDGGGDYPSRRLVDPKNSLTPPELLERQGLRRYDTLAVSAVPLPDPSVERFHAMGDRTLAPVYGYLGAAHSLVLRSEPIVRQDLSTFQGKLADFVLPPEQTTGLASSQAPLNDFIEWVKKVRFEELPSISYGILDEGELGRYQRGRLGGRGSITLNYYIRNMPPVDRANVLLHELFHYWDKEIAKLHYANVSYGYIDPNARKEHEYDAYFLTALFRRHARPDGVQSRLGEFLDKLPTDPAEVRTRVDRHVDGQAR